MYRNDKDVGEKKDKQERKNERTNERDTGKTGKKKRKFFVLLQKLNLTNCVLKKAKIRRYKKEKKEKEKLCAYKVLTLH